MASSNRHRGLSSPTVSQQQAPATKNDPARKEPTRSISSQSASLLASRPGLAAMAEVAPDAFDTGDNDEVSDSELDAARASVDLEDLPIELVTMIDSFIESLAAKVHSKPPNIDRLSHLFQEFYANAASRVGTHIQALATKQSRDAAVKSRTPSLSAAASRLRSKTASFTGKEQAKQISEEQQMITADELADRRRLRRALEVRRGNLEEAVERRLCEGIYDRIYRHRSTQDEAQDDKLRSKTAALALVGIGPTDLGIDLSQGLHEPESETSTASMRERLGQARQDLVQMNESRYPLGKLNRLKAAHKSIVDTLAHFRPSASADEIMPMLIFTLITLPPEHLNVISDIHFIQYFRWNSKLTGEAAYCITNLEAAVSFLQTVDLATLRADELLSGPVKSPSQPGTPKSETFPPAFPASSGTLDSTGSTAPASNLMLTTVLKNRRLSDLVNTPAQAFGAASDAVISTADHGIKTISNSLGDSYNFLVGKLRERQEGPSKSIVVPRTLDDARKLVSTPPPMDDDDPLDGGSSSIAEKTILPGEDRDTDPASRTEHRTAILSAAATASNRDMSRDSSRSGRSGRSGSSSIRSLMFGDESKPTAPGSATTATTLSSSGQSPAVLEQMRNLGNSFNPMAKLSNFGMMRGFVRNTPSPSVAAAASTAKSTDGGDLATAFPDIAPALPPKKASPKIPPPNDRFLDLQSPADLRLGDVVELLKDYRRLAAALKDLDAFEER